MNSDAILSAYLNAMAEQGHALALRYDIPAFLAYYDTHKATLDAQVSALAKSEVTLSNHAVRALMHRWFLASVRARGEQAWDRDYVRSTYGGSDNGCDYIYYPAQHATRLVVGFSSMAHGRFDRYSRYWDPSQQWQGDTAYLFLKDERMSYYLGTDEQPMSSTVVRIITQFMSFNALDKQRVYTVGSSMGGYGALYYALQMGLGGAIVYAPQVTLAAMKAHGFRNWEKFAYATGQQWTDLDMMVHRVKELPFLYLEYGHYPADRIAMTALLAALEPRDTLLVQRKMPWVEHTIDTALSKQAVDDTIAYFEKNRHLTGHESH